MTIILLISCGKGNNTRKIAFSTTDQDSIMNLHDHEELNLFITPTGHITTSILVNGKPCLFMIDTGAGHVAGIAPVVHPADEKLRDFYTIKERGNWQDPMFFAHCFL